MYVCVVLGVMGGCEGSLRMGRQRRVILALTSDKKSTLTSNTQLLNIGALTVAGTQASSQVVSDFARGGQDDFERSRNDGNRPAILPESNVACTRIAFAVLPSFDVHGTHIFLSWLSVNRRKRF